jgi:RimJ/RimL family protein N-acetyltransferase
MQSSQQGSCVIQTRRLRLIAASAEMLDSEPDHERFGTLLGAVVPQDWPPELYDDGARQWSLEQLRAGNPPQWLTWYFVLRGEPEATVIGVGGFKGPPHDGTAEVGYGVLPAFRCRGLASEATNALIGFAFDHPQVKRVIAETYPELTASRRVMEKCGMKFVGPGSEPGVIQYAIGREELKRTS